MSVPDRESRGEEIERQQFRDAVAATLEDLAEGQRKVADHVPGELADVFGAYQMILKGANLSAEVERGIAAGQTAASALRTVVAGYALSTFVPTSSPRPGRHALGAAGADSHLALEGTRERTDQRGLPQCSRALCLHP